MRILVAQDIDPLVAKMCYIQLSLLGCSGVVIIGNTLEGRSRRKRVLVYNLFILYFGIGILARKRRQEEAKKAIVN